MSCSENEELFEALIRLEKNEKNVLLFLQLLSIVVLVSLIPD